MRRPAPRPVWPALSCVLALTACAQPAPAPAPALALSRDLLVCRARPAVPAIEQDADLMLWILDIDEAGEDCRQRLSRLREVIGPVDRE
jgi:hypothetical protein